MRPNRDTRRRAAALMLCMLLCIAATVLSGLADALWTSQGSDVRSSGGLTVDCSHAAQGYVLAKVQKSSSKIKLRITCGDRTYDYDLNSEGNYEVFPLQMGSGSYKLVSYRRLSGNKYTKQAEIGIQVKMQDENAVFLYPSQYVNYSPLSPAVAKSNELCQGLTTDAQKVEAIRSYMARSFSYDYVRALTAPKKYLGDVDGCYNTRLGLCQDLAAVAACMLRVQGIPTQLAIGKAGSIDHAWNYVLINGEYQLLDITAEVSFMAPDTKYTVERIY